MTDTTMAMVLTGPQHFERREFPMPTVGDDDGIIRVEATGLCGSDYEFFSGRHELRGETIIGHEPVGVVEAIGDAAARRWGVSRGDRVAVEPLLPCGGCQNCHEGQPEACTGYGRPAFFGSFTLDEGPVPRGSYAQYMYLPSVSRIHRIDPSIPADLAVMFNPLAAGVDWAVSLPRLRMGDTVAILGCGQRGLMAVIAAREARAGEIIVTGLAADAHKLELALELGATHAINVEADKAVDSVRRVTAGRGADVVLDVSSMATEPVADALRMARPGGTIVLAGTKAHRSVENFVSDRVVLKGLTIIGALGVNSSAYRQAIRIIESGRYPLEKLHTHTFPLEEAERAVRTAGGEFSQEKAVHVALVPA
jgi:threonine dehydrogenase-like Zn-dependent dehydrogenase